MKYKKSDIKFGQCVYCGKKRTITDDHIPPKNIFSRPRPDNLITVPSCHICNNDSSLDDEYFWITMSVRQDVYNHPDISQNKDVINRAINHPNKYKFRQSLENSIEVCNAFSNSGLYLGKKHYLNVHLERLNRVVERIIKGLYFHHTHSILSNECITIAYITDCFISFEGTEIWEKIKDLFEILQYEQTNIIGNNIFEYKFKIVSDDNKNSLWILKFYNKVYFAGATIKRIKNNN